MSTAKPFSIGVAASTVIVVTQQKKDKSSPGASTAETAAYENANANDVESINGSRNRNINHSYLDSISVVSSAGQGRQSYLDELSESSPLTFDDSSYATTWPEMTQSVDEDAESHHFSSSIGESAAAGSSGASYLESMNGKQPSMAPDTATSWSEVASNQHSLQNGETPAEMPRLSYLESLSAGTSTIVSQDYGQSYLNSL